MIVRFLILVAALFAQTAAAQTLQVDPVVVIRTFPHDTGAFTEGLLIDDGTLYESTGRERASTIRRVDLATGHVLNSVTLPPALFGEGIVAWKHQLFSVTWHGGQGFRWSLPDLKRTGAFRYAGEGWAMTRDDRALILSDGTPVLRFLDPATLKVTRRLTVTANGAPVTQLNELEYVEGEIFANVWMTPLIARIDPTTGEVRGWIDLSSIIAAIGMTDPDAVANGIAYDRKSRRLFVTGKNWPALFEIALPPRETRKSGH